MPVSYVTQGDSRPKITATLRSGAAVQSLTGASVVFHARSPAGVLTEAAATVEDAAGGIVSYAYTTGASALLELGDYTIQWVVTFADATVTSFPDTRSTHVMRVAARV